MLKIVRKLFTSILAMLLAIGPITISNNEVHAEDAQTQEVKVTVHWDDDDNAKNYRPETFTVNLYTEKIPFAKYAVAIYGIGQDTDENGKTMGLTFGPALGANYVNSYKSHIPSGNTLGGNTHRCVHNDDWTTIIYWNNVDPYVYEQCIAENCTHSVELHKAGETIINSQFKAKIPGDGVSVFNNELEFENLRWHPNNNRPNDNNYYSQFGSNYGGWGASRIRAMLNGADELTDVDTNKYATDASSDIHKSASIYTSTNNLLKCFPEELQDAIGKRKTLYDSVYNAKTEANLKATYDKLWLLSPAEINYIGTDAIYQHPLEAGDVDIYQKFIQNNVSISFNKQNTTNESYQAYQYSIYSNLGSAYEWWLRSTSNVYGSTAIYVYNSGNISNGHAQLANGVAPCFALSRNTGTGAIQNNNFLANFTNALDSVSIPTVVNAEGEDGKYSLTLPTADGDVDYVFHIPANEEVTRITAQEPNNHYEQELDLDLSDMSNLKVNMRSTGPKVPGSTAKLKKYFVVKNDTEIPDAEFSFTVSAGTAVGAADNHATVYAGKDPDKVKVNGIAKTGKVTFTAGEDTNTGPLTGVATAGQKYAMKDIVLDFSQVSFDEPGVYRYILTEQENTNSAINNDSESVRVVDVHVMWNDDETELVVDGYVGYYGSITEAPKLLPPFEYEYEDTNGDEIISNEEKQAQKEAYDAAYSDFIASIQDGSGKPAGSYVNAQEPIEVEVGEKSDKYVNNLDSANLSLTKEVTGNQGSKDQYFEFTVAINNAGKNTVMTLDMSEAENGITHENSATTFSKATMDEANSRDDISAGLTKYYYPFSDVLYAQLVQEMGEELEHVGNGMTGYSVVINEDPHETRELYAIYFGEGDEAKAARDAFKAEHPREDMSSYPQVYLDEFIEDIPSGTADKVGQQIVADDNGEATITVYLHHNQTAKLKGLPKGTTYTITETATSGYNTTSENEIGVIDTADIAAKFINERSGVVPTGILVSASGGLALLGLCIFGFILSFRRKLREED